MIKTLKPTGTRILVEEIKDPEQKSAGGILIPQKSTSSEKIVRARVIELGPKVPEGELAPGDTVRIDHFGGVEVTVDGRTMILLNHSAVQCKECPGE